MSPLLDIQNLSIQFPTSSGGVVQAVEKLSIQLYEGKTLGLVGESGSGKSTTALSILRLLPQAVMSGSMIWQQESDLLSLKEAAIQRIRGREIGMIFQEPMSALNPVFRCGAQLEENIRLYSNLTPAESKARALYWMEKVGIQEPLRVLNAYPHEISGGQKQRVMIAMAMAGQPRLLIADEPTTALDVSIQKKIIDLLKSLQDEFGMSMLFISHDLGLISDLADQTAVLRRGRLVDYDVTTSVLSHPQSDYTRGLLACRPSMKRRYRRLPTLESPVPGPVFEKAQKQSTAVQEPPLLEVKNLSFQYSGRKQLFTNEATGTAALQNICFDLFPGETLGIVGESGSGKTTLGKTISCMLPPSEGQILFQGQQLNAVRKDIQMIFQDPYAALNPMMQAGITLLEALRTFHPKAGKEDALQLLETVGLHAEHYTRYPHEFSGGQRQRICIARALAAKPSILVCDEITSSLDVSIQATVLNLLLDLQEQFRLSYLFISHDLSVIRQMSDRLLVLKDGVINAYGEVEDVMDKQPTEYVRMLLEAVPGK